ncbi:unnamed protein product [Closterium sp. NIES-53]
MCIEMRYPHYARRPSAFTSRCSHLPFHPPAICASRHDTHPPLRSRRTASFSPLPPLPFPLSLPPPSLPFPLSSSRPQLFSGQPIHAMSSSLLSHPSTHPFPSPAAAHADVNSGARTPPTSPTPPLLGLPPTSSPTLQHPPPLVRPLLIPSGNIPRGGGVGGGGGEVECCGGGHECGEPFPSPSAFSFSPFFFPISPPFPSITPPLTEAHLSIRPYACPLIPPPHLLIPSSLLEVPGSHDSCLPPHLAHLISSLPWCASSLSVKPPHLISPSCPAPPFPAIPSLLHASHHLSLPSQFPFMPPITFPPIRPLLTSSPRFHPHPSPPYLVSPRFHPHPSPPYLVSPRFHLLISSPLHASQHLSLPSHPPLLHPFKNLPPFPSFPAHPSLPLLPSPSSPSLPFPPCPSLLFRFCIQVSTCANSLCSSYKQDKAWPKPK